MNKKVLSKLLVVLLLVIMVINNISYAVNITNDDLKGAFRKIFGSSFEVETKMKMEVTFEPGDEGVTVENENSTGTSTVTSTYTAPNELEITDSQIILKESEEGKEFAFKIDYVLEDNVLKFESKLTQDDFSELLNSEDETENALLTLGLIMMGMELPKTSFLAAAEAVGVDLEVANSYYYQIDDSEVADTSEDDNQPYDETEENEIYKRRIYFDNTNLVLETYLEVYLNELAGVDENDLDGTVESKITFISTPEEPDTENNTVNNTTNNVTNNTSNNTTNKVANNTANNTANNVVNNKVNNVANNVVKNTSNKVNNTNKTVDNTVTNKIIPAAGAESLYYIVMSLMVISLLIYIKIRRFDDVK